MHWTRKTAYVQKIWQGLLLGEQRPISSSCLNRLDIIVYPTIRQCTSLEGNFQLAESCFPTHRVVSTMKLLAGYFRREF